MPFGEYEDFDACVRANQDKDDPEAYCAEIKREVEGADYPRENMTDDNITRLHQPVTDRRQLADVERKEEKGNAVRYRNLMLLAPGEWTDAASRTTIFYSPDAIKRSSSNWVDNQVNLYHEPGNPVANVGHIDTDSVHVDQEGSLYGDVILHGRTSHSQDAIGLMDLALETDGDQGMGGPSVEIPEDVTEWDSERRMERMLEMKFSGAALVMHPASKDVAFEQQFKQRAVAMSEATIGGEVHAMMRAESTKAGGQDGSGMGEDSPDNPYEKLRQLSEQLEEVKRELQNPTDELLAAIDQYLASEGSPEDTAEDLLQWVQENASPEAAEALMGFLDTAGTGSVADVQEWAAGATTSEEEAEETSPEAPTNPEEELVTDEEPEEPAGPSEPAPDAGGGGGGGGESIPNEKARAVVSALDEVASTMDQVASAIEDEIDDIQVEMQEDISEVKKRLAALEEETESPRTMADPSLDPDDDKDMLDAAADQPIVDGRFITR